MTKQTPVWFITGASSGLGQALAQVVLARGWRAVLAARRLEALAEPAAAHGERARPETSQLKDAERTYLGRRGESDFSGRHRAEVQAGC